MIACAREDRHKILAWEMSARVLKLFRMIGAIAFLLFLAKTRSHTRIRPKQNNESAHVQCLDYYKNDQK